MSEANPLIQGTLTAATLLRATWACFLQRGLQLFGVITLALLPFVALFLAAGVAFAVFISRHPINLGSITASDIDQGVVLVILGGIVIVGLVAILSSVFVASATYRVATDWVEGRSSSIGEVMAFSWSSFGASFAALGVYSTVILLGLIACILPGIAASLLGVFTVSAALHEKRGGVSAFQRSVQLVVRHWVELLIVGALLFVVALVVAAFGLTANYVGQKLLTESTPLGLAVLAGGFILRTLFNLLFNIFTIPMTTIAYHLAARSEGENSAAVTATL